jgi:NAD+-dependent protein deacetylase sirtuin 4
MLRAMPAPALIEGGASSEQELDSLITLLSGRRPVAVLTGAGCSTESGIPDYRGAGRPTNPRGPIQHDAFLRRPEVRQRYWARATLGWVRFAGVQPNAAHRALAALEGAGLVNGVITQNVDRLHHQAGSCRVVELHGALAEVICLGCGERENRADLQRRVLAANPGWLDRLAPLAPDGDAELPESEVAGFRVPACLACGGVLKPDVVFFGGNVAPPTLQAAFAVLEEAQALLVVGSSLAVYSGYRFALRARERGMAIAVVNLGPTRADALAGVRLQCRAGEALVALAGRLRVAVAG